MELAKSSNFETKPNIPMKLNEFVAVDREYDKCFFEAVEPTGVGKAKKILSRIFRIFFSGEKT